jgi:hypothetical protein
MLVVFCRLLDAINADPSSRWGNASDAANVATDFAAADADAANVASLSVIHYSKLINS